MSSSESTPSSFLDSIACSENRPKYSIKIPKKELKRLLAEFLAHNKDSSDPALVFEEWEPILRKQKSLVGKNLCVHYNGFTDDLVIEIVPNAGILERIIENYNADLRPSLVENIVGLGPKQFVRLLENVFSSVPWAHDVNITKWTRDGGIDFSGKYVGDYQAKGVKLLGQAKHWVVKVGPEPIRSFIGSMALKNKTLKKNKMVGVFVSTAGFSQTALREIERAPYKMLSFDVESLANLMIEHTIGVKSLSLEGKNVDERFWEEIKE